MLVVKLCEDAIISFPFVSHPVVDGDKESWLFIRPIAGDACDNTELGAVSGIKGTCSSYMPLLYSSHSVKIISLIVLQLGWIYLTVLVMSAWLLQNH